MSRKTDICTSMAMQLESMVSIGEIPPFEREYHFAKEIKRMWRFDFAWPEHKVAFEVEGGVHMKKATGHTSSAGFRKDCHKYDAAAVMRWIVLRGEAHMITKGYALEYVIDVLKKKPLPTLRWVQKDLYMRQGE